ncbi:serine-rich adhesin for platelets [Pseudorasbora parva]|uniref:serine-rich adhesin for platelets n=1 Tax=Pseudorasbora parva TaxID=51549 RepID=UPI00351ED8F0
MGQNQGKEGEPVQDNSSAGPEEKGPSPDPGGATEEGNPTIETDVGTDEEKAAGGRLDGGPGRESPSPTPEHSLDSHDKVCAPTDAGVVEGGDGEKVGGKKNSEEGRAESLAPQQLNGITQSDSGLQGTWKAGEPDHERKDLENMLEDYLEHQENLGCNFPGKDKVGSAHRGENSSKKCASYVKDKMESVCGDDDKLKCQEEEGKLDFDAACDIGLTNTWPTSEIIERKGISKPCGGDANINVHFMVQDKALIITENLELDTSMIEPQNKRLLNKPGTSNPVINSQMETSKDITEAIQQVKEGIREKPPENLDKVVTENPNAEHSSQKNVETQGRSMKNVFGAGENVTRCRPTDDVIKTRFTSSSLAGADLKNRTVSLERAQSPKDLSALEVASKSPRGHAESHRKISAGEFTQDELQKERQFNVSDLESLRTKEPSLKRSPAGGHKNKDGIRETKERENLESASKGLYRSHAKKTEIKDCSLRGTETEEGCFVTSNIASASMLGENKPLLQSYEDEKCITLCDSYPPSKSDVQVMQKDENEDSPLSAKAKVHTEISLEWFLAEMSPHALIQTLPETVKDTTHRMDPESNSSLSAVINVEDATKEQQLAPGNMTSSERDKVSKSNQNTISSKTDVRKETSANSSISELIAGPETASSPIDDRLGMDKKTGVTLSGSSPLQEQCFLNILTNASTHSIASQAYVCDQVQDGCIAGTALADSTATTSAPQDVQHSSSMCNLISMQANEKQDKEQNKLSTQANFHMLEEKHLSQLDQKHAIKSDLNTIMEPNQGAQKRHVSDMIKETIELQKKMKEWTKPTDARSDLTLDPTQSVKVSQMKAAFDTPKKSPDKALERKPSLRKGRNMSEKLFI